MRLDFCINRRADTGAGLGLNTIFRIWGDSTYQTPRKEITPGTIYFVYTTQGLGQIRCDGQSFEVGKNQYLFLQARESFGYGCWGELIFGGSSFCATSPFAWIGETAASQPTSAVLVGTMLLYANRIAGMYPMRCWLPASACWTTPRNSEGNPSMRLSC